MSTTIGRSKRRLAKALLAVATMVTVMLTATPGQAKFLCQELDGSSVEISKPREGRLYDFHISVGNPKESWVCVKEIPPR
jgi:hypothetical protein